MPGAPDVLETSSIPGGLYQPSVGDVTAAWLVAGAAAAQLCGTDIVPTNVARPMPADTGALPKLAVGAGPTAPIAAMPSAAVPEASAPGAAVLRACMTDMSAPAWVTPATDIGVNELLARFDSKFVRSPGARPSGVAMAESVEAGGADATGDARFCSAGGTVEITCDSVDCTPALDDVPAAWATAPVWFAAPAALVVSDGELNGVTVAAAAEDPAYPYIAAASCAHIAPYKASVAAIAAVFCPSTFVATSAAN